MKKHVLTPDRVPMTDQSNDSAQFCLAETMSSSGLTRMSEGSY